MDIAYASPSAGLLTILYVRDAGFSGTTVLTMLTVFSLKEANSSMNVTQTQSRSNCMIFSMTFLLKKIASFNVVEVKLSFIMIILLRCNLVQNRVNSDQVILQFAAEIFDVFFLFKMRKESVEQKELRFLAWDGTAYARQIMQLPERAGEGGFTALVRTGYDKYAFLLFQVEIIADEGRLFANEFIGQG